ENGVHALFAHLTQDQPCLGVVAADIENADAFRLQLGNQRGIVFFASRVGFIESRLPTCSLVDCLGGIGETLAIGRLVVDERDLLVSKMVEQVFAGNVALLVVTAAHAEDAIAGTL